VERVVILARAEKAFLSIYFMFISSHHPNGEHCCVVKFELSFIVVCLAGKKPAHAYIQTKVSETTHFSLGVWRKKCGKSNRLNFGILRCLEILLLDGLSLTKHPQHCLSINVIIGLERNESCETTKVQNRPEEQNLYDFVSP
jgi:hypothetical protein